MIERKFIEKGIRNSEMEAFLNKSLERADYSHSDIKRTPLNTRIVIHAGRPGVVIGHAGSKINEMTGAIKNRFKIDNPQIEVKSVENQELDARVVAKQIASSLERGTKHRQIVNIMLKKIMEAGAIGVEISVSGKITGSRSRAEKFMSGYLKKCGNTSDVHTQRAFEKATLKAGVIGIKVKLMNTMPSVLSIEKTIEEKAQEKEAEKKEKEEKEKKDDKEPEEESKPAKKGEESEPKKTEEKKEDTAKKEKAEPKQAASKKEETAKKERENKKPTAEPEKPEPKQEKKEDKKQKPVKKDKKETAGTEKQAGGGSGKDSTKNQGDIVHTTKKDKKTENKKDEKKAAPKKETKK